jgi:hypothetical protein
MKYPAAASRRLAEGACLKLLFTYALVDLLSVLRMRLFYRRARYANETFRKPTVPHGSTKVFSSNGNLRPHFFRELDSEPEAARLSSVKNVTATSKVQLAREFSLSAVQPTKSSADDGTHDSWFRDLRLKPKLRTENRELRTALCPLAAPSFILTVCPNTVDGIRSSYLSCPSVHSNPTGASEARSMVFARA